MRMKITIFLISIILFIVTIQCQNRQNSYNGIEVDLNNLYRLSDAETRSISPENLTGEKGKGGMTTLEHGSAANAARDLGQGWKVNPYIIISANETVTLAEMDGPGAIQHIWMTKAGPNTLEYRKAILRFYWDGEKNPSVEVPYGDFFATGWERPHQISSTAVCVNPFHGFNCYWVMPFREKCKITLENLADTAMALYYQVDYVLSDVPDDAAYFHAQFRQVDPLPYKEVYTIVDNIKGQGQYVGCTMAWETADNGWWGEGEIKFYIDGDQEFPTICGTGTEDYFCGSHCYFTMPEVNEPIPPGTGFIYAYQNYSTPYAGFYVVKGAFTKPGSRFDMYRWHIIDPIRFRSDLRVTIQALGWQGERGTSNRRYLPLEDKISSVAFWYQEEPHATFPDLPSIDKLEIVD